MDNGIGTAYGIVAKEILQIFYRGDRYAVARVIDGGYNSTECLVELEAKFLAAMEVLSQKLYEESGISLPMTVRQAILHADADDPLIIRASQMVQKIGLTEDKKAEIAYQMMRAINWQHQEANYYEYLKCSCSYCPPMPLTVETIKNCQFDPYDDTQFTFIEFNSWPMIEGKYLPITQAIMSVIGIAPLHFVVKQKHQEKQEETGINFQYEPAIEEYIRQNRVSHINPVDAILRHGSFPARLAHKIYEANKPT